MAKYRVKAPVTLYAGTLELTKAQAEPRLHCLEPLKKKTQFNIVEPVFFKVGETIGLVGKPDKALAQRLQLLGKDGEPEGDDDDDNPPPPKPPAGGTTNPPNPNDPPPGGEGEGGGAGEGEGTGDDNTGDGDQLKLTGGDSGDE